MELGAQTTVLKCRQPEGGKASLTPDVQRALLWTRVASGWLLLKAAPLPPASGAKDSRRLELEARYERAMPGSPAVEVITLLYYSLLTFGVAGEASLRRLFELHNAHVDELAADPAYLLRMNEPKGTFIRKARIRDGSMNIAVKNSVHHGRIALHATVVGQLLVEFINHNSVNETMELLA